MGRWSAAHWKTATFGWLAFVLVAFGLGGMVGTKTIDPNTAGPGRVGPHGPDPRRRLQAARRRERPDPEPLARAATTRRSTPRSRTSSRGSRSSRTCRTSARRSTPATPTRSRRTGTRRSSSSRSAATRTRRSTRSPRSSTRVAAAQRAHPGFFIGEFGDASAVKAVETAYGDDLGKAGTALAPDHADRPRARVRRARGGGHSAAARADRRLRDVRADCAAQPCAAGGDAGTGDGAPDRARRRRRLLDVLLEARAQERAAGRSEQAALEAAAATSGRSVLISGLTVMVAMAGMFLTGDATFASLGVATILVVAVAVLGSLTVLPALLSRLGDKVDRGRVPLLGRLAATTARAGSGARSSTASCVGPRSLRRSPPGCCWRSRAPALQLRIAQPGPDTFPKSLAGRADVRPDAAGVPRHGDAGERRRQGAERERAGGARGDRAARAARARERPRCTSRSPSTSTRPHRREHHRPDRRERNRRRIERVACRCCATRSSPRRSARSRTRKPASPGKRPSGRTQADELKSNLPPVVAFVLLFAFASCWSRSARS